MSINKHKYKSLLDAGSGEEHQILALETGDIEIENFLMTLGCYKGEKITVVTRLAGNLVIALRDARYSIDKDLAYAIKLA